ncbi:MAG: hypothetical protein J0H40_05870 [Rhizobiales bacterium]|nr:hypothetical protein [Hyphomicrobiales bacterium]
MKLHDEPESVALKTLPALQDQIAPSNPPTFRPHLAKSRVAPPPRGDTLPEIAERDLLESVADGNMDFAHARIETTWWFPEGFLVHNLECDPAHAVVVVVSTNSPHAHTGDRIVVDTS